MDIFMEESFQGDLEVSMEDIEAKKVTKEKVINNAIIWTFKN